MCTNNSEKKSIDNTISTFVSLYIKKDIQSPKGTFQMWPVDLLFDSGLQFLKSPNTLEILERICLLKKKILINVIAKRIKKTKIRKN